MTQQLNNNNNNKKRSLILLALPELHLQGFIHIKVGIKHNLTTRMGTSHHSEMSRPLTGN